MAGADGEVRRAEDKKPRTRLKKALGIPGVSESAQRDSPRLDSHRAQAGIAWPSKRRRIRDRACAFWWGRVKVQGRRGSWWQSLA